MAIYKCDVCGAVYDEGKPISAPTCCPICKQPVSHLVPVPAEEKPAAYKSTYLNISPTSTV